VDFGEASVEVMKKLMKGMETKFENREWRAGFWTLVIRLEMSE
jgi:hypothetical protein